MNNLLNSPVRHGGNLIEAIRRYGGECHEWLDLSTGVSPWSYPLPEIPKHIWHNLPCSSDELVNSAAAYYGCSEENITVTPGSQLAIRLLPSLIDAKQTVAIPSIGYQEHHYAWQNSGHNVRLYRSIEELEHLSSNREIESAVVINPNNPTGEAAAPTRLKTISRQLPGLLVVDEAFIDLEPSFSMLNSDLEGNVLIMRSLGKFFGLAGARIGFLIGLHKLNHALKCVLNPWTLSGPGQYIAECALNDTQWQIEQRARISRHQACMKNALTSFIRTQINHNAQLSATGLFNTLFADAKFIERIHTHLAQAKIWSRIGDAESEVNWIRFSLTDENGLDRFAQALKSI